MAIPNASGNEEIAQESEGKSIWDNRAGMMSAEEVRKLSAEKGQADVGAERSDQSAPPGPNKNADPSQIPGREGGRRGKLLEKKAAEKRENPPVDAGDWTKYDWS